MPRSELRAEAREIDRLLEEVIVKKLPKRFFQEWFVAVTKARHCYLRPKDIDAWTFFFEWAIEIKRAYAEQNGKKLYS